MAVCFASYNEIHPDRAELGLSDKLCLLPDDHVGFHEWTPTDEIMITFPETND